MVTGAEENDWGREVKKGAVDVLKEDGLSTDRGYHRLHTADCSRPIVQVDVGLSENVGYIPNYSHLIGIMIINQVDVMSF